MTTTKQSRNAKIFTSVTSVYEVTTLINRGRHEYVFWLHVLNERETILGNLSVVGRKSKVGGGSSEQHLKWGNILIIQKPL